jgi:hypothetical protein
MATRTQIYLTAKQRAALDEVRRREGRTLAELIRDAVDLLLAAKRPNPEKALDRTFGIAPRLVIPSRDEWSRHG